MTRKPAKPFRMAPLQKLAVKPIEDPAEQAALDERLKRSEEAASSDPTGGPSGKAASLAILELCHHLPAEGRFLVASELMAQLSAEQRVELVEQWAAQLPPEAMRRVEERLRGQAGGTRHGGNEEDGNRSAQAAGSR